MVYPGAGRPSAGIVASYFTESWDKTGDSIATARRSVLADRTSLAQSGSRAASLPLALLCLLSSKHLPGGQFGRSQLPVAANTACGAAARNRFPVFLLVYCLETAASRLQRQHPHYGTPGAHGFAHASPGDGQNSFLQVRVGCFARWTIRVARIGLLRTRRKLQQIPERSPRSAFSTLIGLGGCFRSPETYWIGVARDRLAR